MANNKLSSMVNEHQTNVFGYVNILFSIITLFTLSASIYKKKDDLKMTQIKKRHISQTSQHFFTNLSIMFIVFVYNISIFITMFFSADEKLVAHSIESKINIAIAPVMTLFVGVHLLGTIKWDFFHWSIRLFVLMPSFIVSLIYQVTFVIFNYQLLVDLNDTLKIHGGAMVRAFIIDGFAVFLTIMYFRAVEQVLHFHKYNAPSRFICEIDGPTQLAYGTSQTSTTSVTQVPHGPNNNNHVARMRNISTTNLLKLMFMVTLFVVIDFFTIDDHKNECTIPEFSTVMFNCLYYTFTYLLLFYLINLYKIGYYLIKINQMQSFNRSFLWWHHIAFIFALIGCLMDDISTLLQRILYPSQNEAHLSNGYVVFVLLIQILFRIFQFHFVLVINKYAINYSDPSMKNIKFYGKFLVLTNCCLIGHYFLYEMRHKEHMTEAGHEPDDDAITVIQILVAFLNIEFYLAAVEKIDLYKYLLIHDDSDVVMAENANDINISKMKTNPKDINLLTSPEEHTPVIIGVGSQSVHKQNGIAACALEFQITDVIQEENQEIELLNQRITVLEKEKKEQYEQFEEKRKKWDIIAAENKDMKQVIVKKQNNIDTLQNTLDKQVDEKDNLKRQMMNKVNELNDVIQQLNIEKNNLNEQCEKMSNDFEEGKLKTEQLKLKLQLLEQEIVAKDDNDYSKNKIENESDS